MAISTYAELKAEIADHLDRDDLTSKIDTFIDLAEARHKRDIRIREMIVRQSITIDGRYEAIPSGVLEIIQLRLLTSPITSLKYVSPEQMSEWRREESGKPELFTMHAELEFNKDPDAAYSGEIFFHKALTPLSDSNTSNALLVRAPDAYLYGSLLATAPYLLDDARIEVWAALYKSAVDGLQQARRQERAVGAMVSRVRGPTP
jgi:hypothetical protein